jgi:hypothetical protein
MDRPDDSPRSALGAALKAAAEAVAPREPDFGAVYDHAALGTKGTLQAGKEAGSNGQLGPGREGGAASSRRKRLFLGLAASGTAMAAALALVVGLALSRPTRSPASLALTSAASPGYALSTEEAVGSAAAIWLGQDPAHGLDAVLPQGRGQGITEAILEERPLELDLGAFVDEVWRTTEL